MRLAKIWPTKFFGIIYCKVPALILAYFSHFDPTVEMLRCSNHV